MNRLPSWLALLVVALLLDTAYVAAFAFPTIPYMATVVLHLALGLGAAAVALWLLAHRPQLVREVRWAVPPLALAVVAGQWLAIAGNVRPHRWALWVHVAAAGLGLLALVPFVHRRAVASGGRWRTFERAFAVGLAMLVLLPAGTALYRRVRPDPASRIRNPLIVPAAMTEEGGGPKSPFFPSSARTNVGGIIPANFFMDSAACGRCHQDIYRQFQSSAHHFASFNNQFYRKSVEYMQDVVGPQPSKWCAGCHDHALFFNGRFERPIKEQIDTPEARAGLACTSCHAITHVDSTMGNGGYTINYPPLHQLLASRNPLIQAADSFLIYLAPEPHRRTFMKPFMRQDNAQFCSACHKVHLDVPVNSYRWFRGFDDYDAWQASGVSGEGARSFYYPPQSKTCGTCHMPLVDSQDPGNQGGKVHSHRFAAANVALAYVNRDAEQLKATEDFLKSGFITVDIFAVAPVVAKSGAPEMVRRGGESPAIASTFAVGEEAQVPTEVTLREVGEVAAPIDRAQPRLRPGTTARVDVVVRTRNIGHFFPGGTVDAFDVWLELQARDATGRVVFWSGRVEDNGKGPVERGAHFYRSVQLDGAGNVINKRNAWQTRSVLYTRLIPPGAADVVHFLLHVPADARGPLTLEARLNYRKFSYYYTQFSYAGQPLPGQDPHLVDRDHNSLAYSYDPANVPANVSGEMKHGIPELPIVTVAAATAQLALADPGSAAAAAGAWRPVVEAQDRERWNDWGIGLLLQGDLKGAEYAFTRTTEADPAYADGWLNVARALVTEGETERARPFVAKALALAPGLPRALFFGAMIDKAAGDYPAALAALSAVDAKYPRDRVVIDQIARLLFLEKRYAEALKVLDRVCEIDPEDLQMHYTAMLCWRALGDAQRAEREAALFRRFKADEASQQLTAGPRRLSPEDNNERQQIHDHESVPLESGPTAAGRRAHQPPALAPAVTTPAGG